MTQPDPLQQRLAHAIHRYDHEHGLTGNDTPSLHHQREAAAALAELRPELEQLAALQQVARGYCPTCGRGDAAPTVEDWEQQRRRADQLAALAHDILYTGQITGDRIARWREQLDELTEPS